MEHIILYGSKYGNSRRYAERLSEQTGIPAVNYKQAPKLANKHTIIYLGSLYAGGTLGLAKTLRGVTLQKEQQLLIVTVGLSDPSEAETRENIRTSLQKQISEELFSRAKIFHLRGGINYQKLSFFHRTLMALLYQSLCKTPADKRTAENRAMIETYGKKVDFTDYDTLAPIIQEIQAKKQNC